MTLVKEHTIEAFVAGELAQGHRPNRLIGEKSPYLLQHAFNPVDWRPWGEEAFAAARRENKPIFLSIGYSTCHWCHVMEHESFEDETLAAILNRDFIPIKVDREERPDLDAVYMAVTQAMSGGGGWPMSVFLTPERVPFYAGTYFPPQASFGRPGFAELLAAIHAAWQNDQASLVRQGEALVRHLTPGPSDTKEQGMVDDRLADQAAKQLTKGYDPVNGGFGGAPKFPRPAALRFLWRYAQRVGDGSIRDMVTHTLRQMAAGGIHDQLGGGFHRYAVDAAWRLPHFEKMLPDQAQLAVLFLEASQLSHDPLFREVAAKTLDYALRSLRDGGGGFASAEDADSPRPEDRTTKGEGAYYLWTAGELGTLLGSEASPLIGYRFGVLEQGNALADPHGDFRGKNILYLAHGVKEMADYFAIDEAKAQGVVDQATSKLLTARDSRPRPHLDDKVLTSWNGLMLSALAKGSLVLGQPRYLQAAQEVATFIRDRLVDPRSGHLWHRFRAGEAGIAGLLDDYAFTVAGLLDLYQASFDSQWLALALQLTERQVTLFEDGAGGGFYATSGEDRSVIARLKTDYDGAEPAGSSVAALNLLRLGAILGQDEWWAKGEKTVQAFAHQLRQSPGALPEMMTAYEFKRQKPRQVVLAGERGAADTVALQRVVTGRFLPNTVVILADEGPWPPTLVEPMARLRFMTRQGGKATAYLCQNFSCQQPTTDPQVLRNLLTGGEMLPLP